MQSYPFTSQVTYDEQGLPLYDRAVDSGFLRKVYAQYWTDGVFHKPTNALQVVSDTGMQVAVEPGVCHIQGAMGIESGRRTLVVQAAESMDRIDTVVARLDLSVAVRSIDLYVLKGTAAESPQAPALTRDATIWEIGLANIFVARNTSTISQQRITDTRLDISRCGLVAQTIGDLDTSPYFAQLTAQIAAHQEEAETQIALLKAAIEAVEGDSAWMMKNLYDPQDLREDLGIQLYTHSKQGTVHNFVGTGMNGRALITAAFQNGDTVQLNGVSVTATCGADPVDEDTIVNGRWVSFVADAEGGQINFKGGGGLGNSRLKQATAGADMVSEDATFYAGDKTLKTGTLVERGQYAYSTEIGGGGASASYYTFNNIPEGIYRKNGADWAPEIRMTASNFRKQIGTLTSAQSKGEQTLKGDDSSYTFNFSTVPGYIYVIFTSTHGNRPPDIKCTNLTEIYRTNGHISAQAQADRSTCWTQVIARATTTTAKVYYRQYDQYSAGNVQVVELRY